MLRFSAKTILLIVFMAIIIAIPTYAQDAVVENPNENNQLNTDTNTQTFTEEEKKAALKAQKLANKEAKKLEQRAKKERKQAEKEAKKKEKEDKKAQEKLLKEQEKEAKRVLKEQKKAAKGKSKQNNEAATEGENDPNKQTEGGDENSAEPSEKDNRVLGERNGDEKKPNDKAPKNPQASNFLRFQIETAEESELLLFYKDTDLDSKNKNAETMRNELLSYYGFPAIDEGKVDLVRANSLYSGNIKGLAKKMTTITGNAQVLVKEGGMFHSITAEKIDINQEDDTINAYGSVVYSTKIGEREQRFVADEFVFSSATFEAMLIDVIGSSSNVVEDVGGGQDIFFYYKAKRMVKGKDNLIVLNDVIISTCDDLESEDEDAHYHFKVKKIWAISETEFAAKGMAYYVGHVPMFYLPVYYQKDIFINPAFYYDQRMGFGVNTTIYLKGGRDKGPVHMGLITGETKKEDPSTFKFMADYYSKLGFMGGLGASQESTNFDMMMGLAYSRTVFRDYYLYQGPFNPNREVNHGYMFGTKVPFRFGLASTAKVGDWDIIFDAYSDPFFAEDFFNRTEQGAFFSMLGKKTKEDDIDYEEKSEIESRVEYSKEFTFEDNPIVDTVNVNKVIFSYSARSIYDSDYGEYSPNREFFVPKQLNMPDTQFEFKKQWYLNKDLEEKNKRKKDRFDDVDLKEGERVNMSGEIVDNRGQVVKTNELGYRLNDQNEPIFKDGKVMDFDSEGNIVDLLGNKIDRYGRLLYYNNDGRRVDGNNNLIDKDGNPVDQGADGLYRNSDDELVDKHGELVFEEDGETGIFYNRFGQTLIPKTFEVDWDAPENQAMKKLNDFANFRVKPQVEDSKEREWQPSVFYNTVVNERIYAEPNSSQWTKPEHVKFKGSDFTNYGSFSNKIGIGIESSDSILTASTTVNVRGSYQTSFAALNENDPVKQTNSSKNEFSAGQGFNFQVSPFPNHPQLSESYISYNIDFDYYQNYYNTSNGEQENKIAFMPTSHKTAALFKYDLQHFYFFVNAEYQLPTMELEGSYLGGMGFEVKGFMMEAGAYGEMLNEPTDSSGIQLNTEYAPLSWLSIGSQTQITYEGKMNYEKIYLKISSFETGAVWERREQFNWDKNALLWNPEVDSTGESVYRFGFSQYYTKVYEEINIKRSADGRVRSALLIDGDWTLDFEKYNDSRLRFGLGIKIDVDNEFEFMFKVSSYNDATYLYFDGMSDALGIAEGDRVGFFEDLFKSFAFWDKEMRQESNFKLGAIQAAITVAIHDWDLIFEYIGEPESNSSDVEKLWTNTFNIMIVFKPFPNSMNTGIKREDEAWSSHKDGSIF